MVLHRPGCLSEQSLRASFHDGGVHYLSSGFSLCVRRVVYLLGSCFARSRLRSLGCFC